MVDPASPGLTLCGWSFNAQPGHRLLTDPIAEGDADIAPLCQRCLRRASPPDPPSDSESTLSQAGSSVADSA
eukprot:13875531-Alexandrium_andersonii.AAC.1